MSEVVCYDCKQSFNKEEHLEEGYSSIAKCPHCGALNSVR